MEIWCYIPTSARLRATLRTLLTADVWAGFMLHPFQCCCAVSTDQLLCCYEDYRGVLLLMACIDPLRHAVADAEALHLCRMPAGAEFEVLEHMVHDGSLLLVDAIEVKWNDVFRPEFLEWPAMYSQVIFGATGGRAVLHHIPHPPSQNPCSRCNPSSGCGASGPALKLNVVCLLCRSSQC